MSEYERKYVRYVTDELKEQINPKNTNLWKTYLNGKRKLSDSTRKGYTSDIMQFFVYILKEYENQFIFDIDENDMADILEDFISMCVFALGNGDRRICRRLSTISSMYIHYKKKRKIKFNPIELLERPEVKAGIGVMKQTFLSKEQVEEIRVKLEDENDIQLKLFFELGLYSMLRVNALSSIKIENIEFDKNRIVDIIEKEGYEVTTPLNTKSRELIDEWLAKREIESNLLFVNKNGRNAKESMQTIWIKKIGKFINVDTLHCHDLRHSGSDLRYKAGMSLEDVSKALNHSGTDVTQKHYLTQDTEKLAQQMEKYEI